MGTGGRKNSYGSPHDQFGRGGIEGVRARCMSRVARVKEIRIFELNLIRANVAISEILIKKL
jgi:hypothetical protein